MSVYRTRKFAVLAVLLFAAIAQGQYLEDSLYVGNGWIGSFAYNPSRGLAYGTSEDGELFCIDCRINLIVGALSIPDAHRVAYDSIDAKVYCTFGPGPGSESLLVAHDRLYRRLATLPMDGAGMLVWEPRYNRVYVSRGDRDLVTVVDCSADTVLADIRVGRWPSGLTLNSNHDRLYVENFDDGTVSVVDLVSLTVVKTVVLAGVPGGACYSHDADKYYCTGADEVLVMGGANDSVVARVDIPGSPAVKSVEALDGTGMVMVGVHRHDYDTVYILDTRADTVAAALPAGSSPRALAWSRETGLAYATGYGGDVIVYDVAGLRVQKTLRVGGSPLSMIAVPEYRRVFIGHSSRGWIHVLRDTCDAVGEGASQMHPAHSLRAHPNPFRHQLTVTLDADAASSELRVFTESGRLVRTLKARSRAGVAVHRWDGNDSQGIEVPRGVYLITSGRNSAERTKVVRLN